MRTPSTRPTTAFAADAPCRIWAVLLTALGTFVCASIACEQAPEGLQGYWMGPTPSDPGTGRLYVTVAHRPFGLLTCVRAPERRSDAVWRCQP